MNNENLLQNIILSIVIALVVSFVVVSVAKPKIDFGGYTAGHWDSADGYKVDGTTVIDGDGNYDGAITGTTATLSSTLTVTGETNLDLTIFGGAVYSTSSLENSVFTAAQICDYSVISMDPGTNINLTLPSTTTLYADCLPTVGDSKIVLLENATSGTANITIVKGDGITLLEEGAGGDVVLAQNEWAIITFTRVDNADCAVTVLSLRDAD